MAVEPLDLSLGRRLGFGEESTGNLLLMFEGVTGGRAAILKIYRRRSAWVTEFFRAASSRLFEGRRGCDPAARRESERRSLALWQREGFDVPALLDLPTPANVTDPALWFEYCPGRTLAATLMDPGVDREVQRQFIERLGRDLAARHRRALELDEPLLIQEHGATTHVLISGERMVSFDLEGGFRPGFAVIEAITQELSGYLRSIARKAIHLPIEAALGALRSGYRDADLLARLRHWALERPTLLRHLKRWRDRRKRPELGKCALLERFLGADSPTTPTRRPSPVSGRGTRGLPLLLIAWLAQGCASSSIPLGPEEDGPRVELSPLTGVTLHEGDEEPGSSGWLHLGSEVAVDVRDYDRRNVRDDQLRLDRARVRLDGQRGEVAWRAVGDLVGFDSRGLAEAWLSWSRQSWVRLTAGLLRAPLGLEERTQAFDLAFVGYTFPAYLGGRTDFGLELDGEFRDGLLSYDLAAQVGEGFDSFGQRSDHPQLSAKLTVYPFRASTRRVSLLGYEDTPLVSGLFVSGACSWSTRFEGHVDVATDLRNKLFATPRLDARDGSRFYFVGYGADLGPFRWLHETAIGSLFDLETASGRQDLDDQITAWAASLSWMVSGEHYDSRPYRQRDGRARDFPARPFVATQPDQETGYGALELAARYANGDIDRRFFDLGVTGYSISSQEFRTFSGAVNWYPLWNLRVTAEVVRTIADQFPGVFRSHGRDTSFILQVQYRF